MCSQLLGRQVELSCLRLSQQSPLDCWSKLSLFIPDKNDWPSSGFQELLAGPSVLSKPVLFSVLKIGLISGHAENQLLLDSVSERGICIRERLAWNSLWDLASRFCLVRLHWFKASCEAEVLLFIDIANPSISSREMLQFCHLRKMSSGGGVAPSHPLQGSWVGNGFLNLRVFAYCWHLVQARCQSFLLLRFHIWGLE